MENLSDLCGKKMCFLIDKNTFLSQKYSQERMPLEVTGDVVNQNDFLLELDNISVFLGISNSLYFKYEKKIITYPSILGYYEVLKK